MIRILKEDDLDWLVNLTVEFNDNYYGIPLNLPKTRETLKGIITKPYGVGFRSEYGAIIGTIEDDPFRDYVVLQERGWFAKKDGLQLLNHFTEYGKSIGVHEIRMTTLQCNNRVGLLLTKRNYMPIETSYGLKIKGVQ